MNPYFFKIETEPLPDNPQGEGIGGALAHVWVFSDNIDDARGKAAMFITAYGWKVKEISLELQPTPAQIADLDTGEAGNYRKAELNGTSATFHAWPKTPRPGMYSASRLEMHRRKKK